MANYIKTVLPSGRGLCLEKLTTRQYRAVAERVASRTGDDSTPASMTTRLGHEILLAAFRAVTADVLPLLLCKDDEGNDIPGDFDVDAMLGTVPDSGWIKPTFEELIILDGSRSLETLLDDPSDYLVASHVATSETLGGGQAGAFRGKVRREYGAR